MRLIIHSRKLGRLMKFWAPDNGGYIRLENGHRIGTLGQQICHGGGFAGDTISATPESFKAACRQWYRAYMRQEATDQ